MQTIYEFTHGPLIWIAFIVFICGSIYRLLSMFYAASKEKVVLPYFHWKYGLRSIFHWIIPFASKNMRLRPAFTIISFVFHLCLIATPILLLSHNILWKQSWNIQWWCLPESITHAMAIAVVVLGAILIVRRIADPTVRYVTSWGDYVFLAIVLAPFVTGILAYYQVFAYKLMVVLHIWTGAIWLMAIPFTKVSHMLFFPWTRAYMGCEFGFVRHAKDW